MYSLSCVYRLEYISAGLWVLTTRRQRVTEKQVPTKEQTDEQAYRDEVLRLLQQLLTNLRLMNDSLANQEALLTSLVSGLTPFKET
jgi:hypothetical protein